MTSSFALTEAGVKYFPSKDKYSTEKDMSSPSKDPVTLNFAVKLCVFPSLSLAFSKFTMISVIAVSFVEEIYCEKLPIKRGSSLTE